MINTLKNLIKLIDKNLIFLVFAFLFVGECYYLYVKFVEFFSIELLSQAAKWDAKRFAEPIKSDWLELFRDFYWYWLAAPNMFFQTVWVASSGNPLGGAIWALVYIAQYELLKFWKAGKVSEKMNEKMPVDEITAAFQPDLNQILWDFMVTYQDAIITWGFLVMLLLAAFLCRDESHTLKSAFKSNGPCL